MDQREKNQNEVEDLINEMNNNPQIKKLYIVGAIIMGLFIVINLTYSFINSTGDTKPNQETIKEFDFDSTKVEDQIFEDVSDSAKETYKKNLELIESMKKK